MGIGLTDEIVPLGGFPITQDTNTKGGYRVVADLTARDAITTPRRKEGMQVYVVAEQKEFRLKASPWAGDDTDWDVIENAQPVETRPAVRVATVGDITLSGLQTIDGVLVDEGDRVLVMNQTVTTDNGIYVANSGVWTRAGDADTGEKLPRGFLIFVLEGTVNDKALVAHTTPTAVTLGDTAIVFDVVVPGLSGTLGAVSVEDPGGKRIARRLRQSDIDPDFNIASFTRTGPAGSSLVRRGDTIGPGFSASATYLSGPPSSASIANSYSGSGDPGDTTLGAWTINAPYASGTATGSILRNGADAGADPVLTVTLEATGGAFTRQASWTITWTSDVYYGVRAGASIAGTDVYNGGVQAGFSDSLQQTRNQTRSFSPAGQYIYFLWPDQSQYTTGTEDFRDDVTGFVFPMTDLGTTTITRNGITRTYRIWRSSNLINSNFVIRVT